jgi:ABC-type multidrug transport system fused ATPase/permease subunit
MFFGVVWMVSQALTPAVIGRTIDAGITHRDTGALVRWSAVVLLLGATTATTGILRHRNALSNFLAAGYTTVQVVTRQAVRLGATLPKLVAAGDVVAVGTSDIAEIGGGLDVTARLSGAIVSIIAVAVIMLTTSVPLGLIVLVGVPVLTALTGFLLRPLHERQKHFRARQGELTARAIDIAAGLRVLRGIGGEAAFASRYRRESQELRGAALAVTRVESGLAAVEVLMPGVIVSGVTFLAARFAFDGRLTVGDLVAFYGYAAFLATPLRTLMEAADNMTRAHVAARRVVRILRLAPEIGDPEFPVAPPVRGSVLADGESGLEIEPGLLIAVVCSDPADADALAVRLTRFADSGRPTLGGVPLADMRVAEVRERVLLARNSDRFFTGTLREELDPGGQATVEEIFAAIDVASARDVIDALEEGLDTEVVDGGRTFSGGQLQRLRLVRALLARREITILVEPTSAVDAHTEARIAENLARVRVIGGDGGGGRAVSGGGVGGVVRREVAAVERGADDSGGLDAAGSDVLTIAPSAVEVLETAGDIATTVVFTSSPLLLDRAHRVAFVEAGRVVSVGTHRDLLAMEPRYAAVVTRGEDEG